MSTLTNYATVAS